jgi:hypothetical protein
MKYLFLDTLSHINKQVHTFFQKITKILTAWLLFAPLEIAVVVSTVIYVAVKTHHFLYLASYLGK